MLGLIKTLKSRVAAFRDDSRGSVSVEAVLIFPIVMWSMLAMFVFFEGYRQTTINQKAANTIADMYSRETASITPVYIDNTKALYDLLAGINDNTRIRVSVVKWSKRRDMYQVEWSEARGSGVFELSNDDINNMASNLPTLPDQERVVLVETWATFQPLFNIGMGNVEMQSFVFTRLRFAPQLRFCDNNCNGASA
ncbi:TadE/TadG family type IV pilus assembly protein [Marimonas arenosa]|uniref:Pilus assembly protein n=1 Tax=Marimonas arenosa TaxID=1795305 RepID=A0AAE3WB46_9RHOB|nr:pilus assembly protein [Marimonas arenosa]MDQ2089457.1 pilus assembly protein [Marimonas arenosa]